MPPSVRAAFERAFALQARTRCLGSVQQANTLCRHSRRKYKDLLNINLNTTRSLYFRLRCHFGRPKAISNPPTPQPSRNEKL